MKTSLQNSESRIVSDGGGDAASPRVASSDSRPETDSGGLGGIADAMRNMGGAGAGGMPDLAGMMNNPAMMQMAQQMMANGGMERLMSNPAIANMVNYIESNRRVIALLILPFQMGRLNSGGDLPSMQELMADPTLRDL
jgi:small glutamine-rich tetratricopeptide repeat-containing protein alpha